MIRKYNDHKLQTNRRHPWEELKRDELSGSSVMKISSNDGKTSLIPYMIHSLIDIFCFSSEQLINSFTNSNSIAGIKLTTEKDEPEY